MKLEQDIRKFLNHQAFFGDGMTSFEAALQCMFPFEDDPGYEGIEADKELLFSECRTMEDITSCLQTHFPKWGFLKSPKWTKVYGTPQDNTPSNVPSNKPGEDTEPNDELLAEIDATWKEKTCPLRTFVNSQKSYKDGGKWDCEGEACTLWCERSKRCALVAISAEIHDRIGELRNEQ